MHVFDRSDTLRRHLRAHRDGRTLTFVPTMGALHDGHGACVRAARARDHALSVCSIFVNPAQFAAGEDLDRYPRTLEADLAKLAAWGCDVVFTPGAADVYPEPQRAWVAVDGLSEPLCGRFRPGHFRGVATVVTKLFGIVRPDVAVFGQKDAQQALIVQSLARQLDTGVRVELVPTVRESDGLAMSSRNAYLAGGERVMARGLFRALTAARALVEAGERDTRAVEARALDVLHDAGVTRVDYAECRRADDLSALARLDGRFILALAAWAGATRLIDNMVFEVGARGVTADVPLF